MGRMAQRGRVRPLTRSRSGSGGDRKAVRAARPLRFAPGQKENARGVSPARALYPSDDAYCSALSVIAVVKAPASGALVMAGFSGLTAASSASTVALKSAGSSAPFDPAVSLATSPIM